MIYLQVSFCCEGSPTDGAGKRLFTSMGPLMNLKGAGRGEVLPTRSADVLFGRTAEFRSWHKKRGNTRGQSWWANEMASANGTLTGHLHFYEGWGSSNKSSWNTTSTCKESTDNVYPNLLLLPSLSLAKIPEALTLELHVPKQHACKAPRSHVLGLLLHLLGCFDRNEFTLSFW